MFLTMNVSLERLNSQCQCLTDNISGTKMIDIPFLFFSGTTLPSSSSNLISFKPHQTASKTTDSSHNISGQHKMDDT